MAIFEKDNHVYLSMEVPASVNVWDCLDAAISEVLTKHPGVIPERGIVGPNIQNRMNADALTTKTDARRISKPEDLPEFMRKANVPPVPILVLDQLPPNLMGIRFQKGN